MEKVDKCKKTNLAILVSWSNLKEVYLAGVNLIKKIW